MIFAFLFVAVANGAVANVDDVKCDYPPLRNVGEQIYAMDTHEIASNVTKGWKDFNATWNVPELPKKYGNQVVYFWPGFKASQPEMVWSAACSTKIC